MSFKAASLAFITVKMMFYIVLFEWLFVGASRSAKAATNIIKVRRGETWMSSSLSWLLKEDGNLEKVELIETQPSTLQGRPQSSKVIKNKKM